MYKRLSNLKPMKKKENVDFDYESFYGERKSLFIRLHCVACLPASVAKTLSSLLLLSFVHSLPHFCFRNEKQSSVNALCYVWRMKVKKFSEYLPSTWNSSKAFQPLLAHVYYYYIYYGNSFSFFFHFCRMRAREMLSCLSYA